MNLELLPELRSVLALALGVVMAFAVLAVRAKSQFDSFSDRACAACGRPPAIIVHVVDLETRQPVEFTLCRPCVNHVRGVATKHRPPWATYWSGQ